MKKIPIRYSKLFLIEQIIYPSFILYPKICLFVFSFIPNKIYVNSLLIAINWNLFGLWNEKCFFNIVPLLLNILISKFVLTINFLIIFSKNISSITSFSLRKDDKSNSLISKGLFWILQLNFIFLSFIYRNKKLKKNKKKFKKIY